jgi:hypothetical protein
MGLRSLVAAVCLFSVSVLSLSGCSKSAQKVQPETRGKRGESCLARNDCDSGLACINGICAKNEFNISVTAKQCTRVECDVTEDCCGDKATEAPAKCADRNETCDPANRLFKDCSATTCTSDATCGEGTCGMGFCSGGGNSATACKTVADCKKDTCNLDTGYCTVSGLSCASDASCLYFGSTVTCTNRVCDCINPAYQPEDPICSDPDCDDICLLRCEDKLCVQDKSCKGNTDCEAVGLQICDGGRCVECTRDSECDTKNDETCESGMCHKPCTQNEECPIFEECSKGDCVYVGCQDDRECILAAARGQTPAAQASASSVDDPRLYKCLASDSDPKHKVCKIPCENDGSCGQFQVCDAGYCKFVGCDSDEQCRAYLGISDQMTSDSKPFIATAKCVDPADAMSTK